MKQLPNWSKFLILLASSAGNALAAEPEVRFTSLGPLVRFDPCVVSSDALMTIYGNPRRILATSRGFRIQRLGSEDRWCVETNCHVAVMELNRATNQIETREVIEANPEWCLSQDGSKIFAARRSRGFAGKTWECFDFASGRSLWTLPDGLYIADVCFSPDGKQLIVLHDTDRNGDHSTPAVSWFDSTSGEKRRQVKLPGEMKQFVDNLSTDFLAASTNSVYVAPPRYPVHDPDHSQNLYVADAFVIKEGAEEPIPIEINKAPRHGLMKIRLGGKNNELIAFYNDDIVQLFRAENGNLTKSCSADSSQEGEGYFAKTLTFSHDQSTMLLSGSQQTLVISTQKAADPILKRFDFGWRLGDYTSDGKSYVSFDDDGGVIRDPETLKNADHASSDERSPHSGRITDATMSKDGNLIVSNDESRLLLWAKDGRLLAELISPNEDSMKCVRMQSPAFVGRVQKIYAADGRDFLEWDLGEIDKRTKRKPINTPKILGTAIFQDGKIPTAFGQLMNIAIDPTETNIVTATYSKFFCRKLDSPADITRIMISNDEISASPRSLQFGEAESKLLVNSHGELRELDLLGKDPVVQFANSCDGFSPKTRILFHSGISNDKITLVATPFGSKEKSLERMQLPKEFDGHGLERSLVSSDGNWMILTHQATGAVPSLAVIDWANKKLIQNIRLGWITTSLAFSPDETQLIAGSSNGSVYVFDFKKLCSPGK